jgi:hypothetical protein
MSAMAETTVRLLESDGRRTVVALNESGRPMELVGALARYG